MAQNGLKYRLQARLGAALVLGSGVIACGGRSEFEAGSGAVPQMSGASIAEEPGSDGRLSPVTIADTSSAPNSGAPRAPELEEASTRLSGDTIWVGSNGRGVEAALFLETSPRGTTLELVEANGRICVRGQLAPVPDGDYPNYWGGEVGLVLASSATVEAPPAEALDTPGFAFRLEGALPPIVRFRVGAAGEIPLFSQFCQHVSLNTRARIEIPLGALTRECWNTGGDAFPVASGATLMGWQIPANEATVGSFDFCIEDIQTLP